MRSSIKQQSQLLASHINIPLAGHTVYSRQCQRHVGKKSILHGKGRLFRYSSEMQLNSEFYKKKDVEENSIFSCWSLMNIYSDEAFRARHPPSGTTGNILLLSPLKTLVHHRGPTGERTIPRERPISFSIPNTQFLTKLSTSILPVSIFWHNCCNIFLETRDLQSPHAPQFRCHSRGVTICSLFRDMTNPHH